MNLDRFKQAQKRDFETALEEVRNGRKSSHWMWYIFPQVIGLGHSEMARRYAIQNMGEAVAYLSDKELAKNPILISQALLQLATNNATTVFGTPDDLKLHSSMTLFNAAPGAHPVFGQVLSKFYWGKPDPMTLHILKSQDR